MHAVWCQLCDTSKLKGDKTDNNARSPTIVVTVWFSCDKTDASFFEIDFEISDEGAADEPIDSNKMKWE